MLQFHLKSTPTLLNLNTNTSITGTLSTSSTSTSTFSGITNNNTLSQASNIYLTNASNIYLKSATDVNNYIKYDLTNDGPQIVGNASISFKVYTYFIKS